MMLNIFLLISSLLLGSTISRIAAKILVFQKGLNLYSPGTIQGIQVISDQMAKNKTYDVVEFLLFFLISFAILGIFYFLYRNKKFSTSQETIIGAILVIFAFIVNIATLFASYSAMQTLVFIVIWYFVTVYLSFKIPRKLPIWREGRISLANGIIAGFYLSIVLHKFTSSIALPLAIFAMVPFYFYIFARRDIFKHPGFIFLLISIFFPYNINFLLALGFGVLCLVYFIKRSRIPVKLIGFIEKLYPFFVLFIFLYNPLFYFGSYDTVEEGFWAGWLQRMIFGQTMYRDFAIYHPPVLPVGLYIFTKLLGASLYNMRLYFHLLQIAGSFVIFAILLKIVRSNWIRFFVFFLIVAYSSTLVRNNMEIRLASGLLPLLLFYLYTIKKKSIYLFLAGAMSGLAVFVSVETGISSIVALVVAAFLSLSKEKNREILISAISGVAIVIFLLFGVLYLNRSLNKFLEYVIFYARSFSLGYQNIAVARPIQSTLIQWIDVNNFVGSSGFLLELVKYILVGAIGLLIILKMRGKFGAKEILLCGIAVFGIVLSRSALARSDEYHIAFVWIVSLLLLGYLLEFISFYSKAIPIVVFPFLILFVGRDATQVKLFQNQLIKFESYGNISGQYPSYRTPRANISTGLEINPKNTDDLVNFIDSNVSKNEYIYIFPQAPEIYFLADRKNATSFDSPTIFFTPQYQLETISELEKNMPKIVVYNPKFSIAGISVSTLNIVNSYIVKNFIPVRTFGDNIVMQPK